MWAAAFFALWFGVCSKAQDSSPLSKFSPKLKQFLRDHPAASTSLSKYLAEAFGKRRLEIYYFYTDNDSVPRASHVYPDSDSVQIRIRENQSAVDECICLLFEVINSEGQQQFQQLVAMAKSRVISRSDFSKAMMRKEFEAVKRTQDIVRTYNLSPQEIAASYSYSRLMNCPGNFDSYLVYLKSASPQRDQALEYQRYYDSIAPPALGQHP
jgi:hypothetical protein